MKIAYHLGAHCTDEGEVLRVLLRNAPALQRQGIAVPAPDLYPALLRTAAAAFAGQSTPRQASNELLAALTGSQPSKRIVLSFESFLAFPKDAVNERQFYPAAASRVQGLASMTPDCEISFHLAIRNPATFLPALSARRTIKGQPGLPQDFDPSELRWSELVSRLRAACPDAPLTIWCEEDSPVIWHRILRELTGHADQMHLENVLNHPASLLTEEGAAEMVKWFDEHEPLNDSERNGAIVRWLEQSARPGVLEMEVDMPGWTEKRITRLTREYDEDCARIAAMPGVRMLLPQEVGTAPLP